MKTNPLHFFVYGGSGSEKSKVIVSLGVEPHTSRLVMSIEEAEHFASDLRKTVAKMPRHREGTPADLGCEVL